jgi:hypothetical protein
LVTSVQAQSSDCCVVLQQPCMNYSTSKSPYGTEINETSPKISIARYVAAAHDRNPCLASFECPIGSVPAHWLNTERFPRTRLTGESLRTRHPGVKKHGLPAWQWLVTLVLAAGVACTRMASTTCTLLVNLDCGRDVNSPILLDFHRDYQMSCSGIFQCQTSHSVERFVWFSRIGPEAKVKRGPQDLSDLAVVYRQLGGPVVHRQNDVES